MLNKRPRLNLDWSICVIQTELSMFVFKTSLIKWQLRLNSFNFRPCGLLRAPKTFHQGGRAKLTTSWYAPSWAHRAHVECLPAAASPRNKFVLFKNFQQRQRGSCLPRAPHAAGPRGALDIDAQLGGRVPRCKRMCAERYRGSRWELELLRSTIIHAWEFVVCTIDRRQHTQRHGRGCTSWRRVLFGWCQSDDHADQLNIGMSMKVKFAV